MAATGTTFARAEDVIVMGSGTSTNIDVFGVFKLTGSPFANLAIQATIAFIRFLVEHVVPTIRLPLGKEEAAKRTGKKCAKAISKPVATILVHKTTLQIFSERRSGATGIQHLHHAPAGAAATISKIIPRPAIVMPRDTTAGDGGCQPPGASNCSLDGGPRLT
jgi:hypothetical protein